MVKKNTGLTCTRAHATIRRRSKKRKVGVGKKKKKKRGGVTDCKE